MHTHTHTCIIVNVLWLTLFISFGVPLVHLDGCEEWKNLWDLGTYLFPQVTSPFNPGMDNLQSLGPKNRKLVA